ncbi:MAG: FtsH protease activity modulator HflK [Burkholderiaceae bacterium]|nr:MAG: FtsH protease activity modulator HflK [Burkholderiaceae bacterium]
MQQGDRDGPPDLDEVVQDLKRKVRGLFGGGDQPPGVPGQPQGPAPAGKGDVKGVVMIGAGLLTSLWLASGVFIVQEGEQAVILTFGSYSRTVGAGISYRAPYPIEQSEVRNVSKIMSQEIGGPRSEKSTGLKDSAMLTQDENIVDISFSVQYKIRDLREYLFESADPEKAVAKAAESAVREIVGSRTMDSVLYKERDALSQNLKRSIQAQLDRIRAGIVIDAVNVKNVQPPEQVQAAFEDAVKANQDLERLVNEGQAHANRLIPEAKGKAAALRQQAEGYKARVVAQAQGDAARFSAVLAEYQKAPAVTRDRMYIDTMRDIYSQVSKVMVDVRQSSNMLYLPLDKIIQPIVNGSGTQASPAPTPSDAPQPSAQDGRGRDGQRSREREAR